MAKHLWLPTPELVTDTVPEGPVRRPGQAIGQAMLCLRTTAAETVPI